MTDVFCFNEVDLKHVIENSVKMVTNWRCWEPASLSEFASQTRFGRRKKKSSANSSDTFCSRSSVHLTIKLSVAFEISNSCQVCQVHV